MPFKYQAGINSVGSYQASGKPFATGSVNPWAAPLTNGTKKVDFPTVTRWVQITNYSGNNLKCGFSSNGVTHLASANYFRIPGSSSAGAGVTPRLEIKVKELYFAGGGIEGFDLVAGLTGISPSEIPTFWSGSSGVG